MPLVVLCFWIGLYPKPFFAILEPATAKLTAVMEAGRPARYRVIAATEGAIPAAASADAPGVPPTGPTADTVTEPESPSSEAETVERVEAPDPVTVTFLAPASSGS